MSMLSAIGNSIKGAVTGFVTGGPAGAAIGAGVGLASSLGGPKPQAPAPMPMFGGPVPQSPTIGGSINLPGIIGASGGITLGGQKTTTTGYTGGVQWTGAGGGGACPRGYHLNKHSLPQSRTHQAVGPRSICVRNRHVNALNGRAASRALRRLKRANKMTRKIHALFHRAPAKRGSPIGRKR